MTPVALWVPLEVTDLDEALDFYVVNLGLSRVDGWDRAGERGAVLRAPGGGLVELVQPAGRAPAPVAALALELPDDPAVDAAHAAVGAAAPAPARFPRGHYGFVVPDPAGHPVLLWSER